MILNRRLAAVAAVLCAGLSVAACGPSKAPAKADCNCAKVKIALAGAAPRPETPGPPPAPRVAETVRRASHHRAATPRRRAPVHHARPASRRAPGDTDRGGQARGVDSGYAASGAAYWVDGEIYGRRSHDLGYAQGAYVEGYAQRTVVQEGYVDGGYGQGAYGGGNSIRAYTVGQDPRGDLSRSRAQTRVRCHCN